MGEASSRLGLYSGNQREAILDPREQQRFVLTQGLCELCRAHCGSEIKTRHWGCSCPSPGRGAFRQWVQLSPGEVHILSTLAGHLLCAGHLLLTASFIGGGLHFAGEGMEALRDGGFDLGHWAGKWLSSGGNLVCLVPKLVPIPFMGP